MPIEVMEVVNIYTLLSFGVSYTEIVGEEYQEQQILFNVHYLLNPIIKLINIFKKDKIQYYDKYDILEKTIIKDGMPVNMLDSLIALYKEIKDFEKYEMEKQTKNIGNKRW